MALVGKGFTEHVKAGSISTKLY